MPFSPTDVLFGFVLPAVAGGLSFAVLPLLFPVEVARRWAASSGLLVGFQLGYWLLALGPSAPTAHWHWLPYLLTLPSVIGPVSRARGVRLVERTLLYALVTGGAVWVLVPTWPDLQPARPAQIILWTACLVMLASLFELLVDRLRGASVPLLLALIMACGAIVLALSGSLRFAQILGAGSGALAGITIVQWFRAATGLEGLSLTYAMLLGGALLIGRVNSFSDVPLASYLLVMAAPLALGVVAVRPCSQWSGVKGLLVRFGAPLAVCATAALLAVIAEFVLAGD